MGAAWRDHGVTIVVALLVLPAASLLAYRWRRHSVSRRHAIAEVGMVAGSVPWAVMLFTPQPAPRSVDLVPLHDLPSWVAGDPGTAAAQIVGNLLVLAALGFFLPLRFVSFASLWRVAAVAVVASGVVETLQWVLAIGRVSSADDVLVNTLGAVLAAAASRPWWARSSPVGENLPRHSRQSVPPETADVPDRTA
ncbi:VanZ family protein [Couchioplanes caeruleus]|uniref:VanZ family protein n=1 Tax=Couchioplanes caeruleus TaxID=56438 RepID=UPI0020C08334|nr:VanZ family protein [Couchioplanes caeruleus]UQU64948.1 VanZ family protein [Couchioplanes caeruleus]